MKKFVAILSLVLVLCMIGATLTACGEDTTVLSQDKEWRYQSNTVSVTVKTQAEVDDYIAKGYTVVSTGKKTTLERTYYSLVSYTGNEADVTVPASVDGHTIEAVESGLFMRMDDGSTHKKMRDTYAANTTLETVTFACDIDAIPSMTFYMCEALTSVTLPANVKSIGDFSFFGCKSLTSLSFPATVQSIGEYAFRECGALTSITINNAADDEFPPYIGDKCFYMLNEKSSDDDQYYIIPTLKIYVASTAVFDAAYIHQAFKTNKNNDYRNWLVYIGEKKSDDCFVYDLTTQQPVRTKEAVNG